MIASASQAANETAEITREADKGKAPGGIVALAELNVLPISRKTLEYNSAFR